MLGDTGVTQPTNVGHLAFFTMLADSEQIVIL